MYQIEPIGVVVPRHKGDVQAVIETPTSSTRRCCPAVGVLPWRTDCRARHRFRFFEVHEKRPGREPGRTLVPRSTGTGPG